MRGKEKKVEAAFFHGARIHAHKGGLRHTIILECEVNPLRNGFLSAIINDERKTL